MKAVDIRQKSKEEKNNLLADFRKELFNLRVQKKTGQIEKVGRIRVVKKEIARILTILSETE